jgi:alkylresorcinol/alkylpyrone synthase
MDIVGGFATPSKAENLLVDIETTSSSIRSCLDAASMQFDLPYPSSDYKESNFMTLASTAVEQVGRTGTHAARLLGLGIASPAHSIMQSDAAKIAQDLHITERWHQALPALYRKSGVNRRGSVLLKSDHETDAPRQTFYQPSSTSHPRGPTTAQRMEIFAKEAAPLLVKACTNALDNARIKPTAITHLVTVSCTGFAAPGCDLQLIDQLGLNENVQRINVGFMGCHGAINAIRVAKSFIEADPNVVVLVGAVELCSIHQQYTDDPQQLVANALFADGAAAMVVGSRIDEPSNELLTGEIRSNDESNDEATEDARDEMIEGMPGGITGEWTITSSFSQVLPQTSNLMSWKIGDFGFQMSLDPQVPSCIESSLHAALSTWLDEEGLNVDLVDVWAIHPGGPRIVQASGMALGLSEEQLAPSLAILANHGNMSSPTVLFILNKLMNSGGSERSKNAVLLAFGPGLCIEACLLSQG